MRRLERLSLITRRIRSGRGKGERRSTKRGSSVEFADYRDYTPGDDLRRLDWRAFARLERPFIKLFEEEEDQAVHLVLDASRSMDWPNATFAGQDSGQDSTDVNKWHFACRLVAALGYMSLASGDRLTVSTLGEDGINTWGPYRGRGHIHALLNHLAQQNASGPTDLNQALGYLAQARTRPGLLFLLSDFFSPGGYEHGLLSLGSAGYESNILHLLTPDEIAPSIGGDLRLIDVETGSQQEMSIDHGMRQLYQKHFNRWREGLERYCFTHNMNYLLLETSLSFDSVIAEHLRKRGFVR